MICHNPPSEAAWMVNQDYIYHSNSIDEAELLTNRLLELPSAPDCIFSISDQVVAGVMIAIYKKKLKVPEQIAVLSSTFNNGNPSGL